MFYHANWKLLDMQLPQPCTVCWTALQVLLLELMACCMKSRLGHSGGCARTDSDCRSGVSL
jgi:hypothetical protein